MTTTSATQVRNDGLLRLALKLDGAGAFGMGVLALLVDAPLGLPRSLEIGLGVFLVALGVGILGLSTRPVRQLVGVVVLVNTVWVLDSLLSSFAGWFPVTGLGVVVILAQAAVVAGVTVLEVVGLRRAFSPA
jgi:hypothetical protein